MSIADAETLTLWAECLTVKTQPERLGIVVVKNMFRLDGTCASYKSSRIKYGISSECGVRSAKLWKRLRAVYYKFPLSYGPSAECHRDGLPARKAVFGY
jgi:hypothetical protein